MKLSILLFSLFAAFLAVGAQPTEVEDSICGSTPSSEEVQLSEVDYEANKPLDVGDANRTRIVVNVHFHVVYRAQNRAGGFVTNAQITDQIRVLNREFARTDITFRLVSTTRTRNAIWFVNAGNPVVQAQMKRALRRGGRGDLNIYTVGSLYFAGRSPIGIATFPMSVIRNPTYDGIIVLHDTLPGGSRTRFNLGKIAVHEAGHWVGLFHTFQGGCLAPGDSVSDTPAEASPASGCPVGRNTCPAAGLDPVRNHMDYTDDSCRNQFTNGQTVRLRGQINTYRGFPL